MARGDRKWPLNDAQRPQFHVVRVALGTGYNPCDTYWEGVVKLPRELISQLNPNHTIRNFLIA